MIENRLIRLLISFVLMLKLLNMINMITGMLVVFILKLKVNEIKFLTMLELR